MVQAERLFTTKVYRPITLLLRAFAHAQARQTHIFFPSLDTTTPVTEVQTGGPKEILKPLYSDNEVYKINEISSVERSTAKQTERRSGRLNASLLTSTS
jgi:hypothetical protein